LGRRHLTVEQLSAGIYGTLVSSAALVGAAHRPLGAVAGTVVTTVVVYWIAEEYASGLAHRAATGRHSWSDVLHGLRQRFTMVEASAAPLGVVLTAGALGWPVSAAVTAGLVVAAVSLTALALRAAHRSGVPLLATVLAGTFAAALGAVIMLVKLALH